MVEKFDLGYETLKQVHPTLIFVQIKGFGGDGPYSAVRNGNYRLIEFHEDNSVRLYNLADDIGEQTDLAPAMPRKAAALRSQLHQWRKSVAAQMPTMNPDYDPQRADSQKKSK